MGGQARASAGQAGPPTADPATGHAHHAPLRVRVQQFGIGWPLGMNSRVSLLHLHTKAFPACCNLLHQACSPAIAGKASSNHTARPDLLQLQACRNFQMTSTSSTHPFHPRPTEYLSQSQLPFAPNLVLAPDHIISYHTCHLTLIRRVCHICSLTYLLRHRIKRQLPHLFASLHDPPRH